jgi:photosystem II stability/assembly factor-like uncharacterized protein
VTDYPLDDGLLVALRSTRPDLGANESDADDPEALDLLERILSSDTHENQAFRAPDPPRVRRRGRSARSRVRLVAAIAALGLVALVVPLVVTSTQSPNSTGLSTHPAWRLVGNITQPTWAVGSTTGASPFLLACPSALTCYAVGTAAAPSNATSGTVPPAEVEVTNDGGANWTALTITTTPIDYFGAPSCPTTTTCMVEGDVSGSSASEMFTTTDGGQSWSSQPSPGQGNHLLSCATSTHCVSLESQVGPGGHGVQYVSSVTSDGGATWASSFVPGTFRAYALQCVTASVCIATGQAPKGYEITNPQDAHGIAAAIYSTDGGATWTPAEGLGGGDVIGALSCADASHCMVIDASDGADPNTTVLTSSDGGQTWSADPTPGFVPSLTLTHVSCPTPTDCWLTGTTSPVTNSPASAHGVILSTTDGGQTFESEQVPSYQGTMLQYVGPVACSTASSCLAFAPPPGSSSPFSQQLVLSFG